MNDNKKYIVYIHTSPNNKKYVGITSAKNPKRRWKGGYGYYKNKYFYRAIKKYGWNNFDHQIISDDLCKEDACKMEIELIKKYNTRNPTYGYNSSIGGETSKGCGKKYEAFGQCKTLAEWADEYDKDYYLLIQRINRANKSLEDALIEDVKSNKTCVSYNGEVHSLTEWSKIYNIKYATLVSRFDRGIRGDKLFSKNIKNIFVEYNNEVHTLKEWSRITNIPYETLRGRYHIQGKRGASLFAL